MSKKKQKKIKINLEYTFVRAAELLSTAEHYAIKTKDVGAMILTSDSWLELGKVIHLIETDRLETVEEDKTSAAFGFGGDFERSHQDEIEDYEEEEEDE